MLVTNCKRGCITIILQGSIFHKKDKAALGSKPMEKKKKKKTLKTSLQQTVTFGMDGQWGPTV